MSDVNEETVLKSDDAVEALLERAAPRPAPPDEDLQAVRDAVHAEWQIATGSRRRRKQFTQLAVAASVLIAVFVSLNTLRIDGVADVQVAAIEKQYGLVRLVGENAQLTDGVDLASILAGQVLDTSSDSGLSLAWAEGGSLRIGADTRVEFVSREEIRLRRGRVYFDSEPALSSVASVTGSDAGLRILTDFGEVRHIGTQFMVHADERSLTVSVREGEVEVTSGGDRSLAGSNQQLAISGSGVRSVVNFRPYGDAWRWVERTSPAANLDGRSLAELLDWVSRETGLGLDFESNDLATRAQSELLNGRIESGPREALQVWMLGTDLEWRIESGVIYVTEAR